MFRRLTTFCIFWVMIFSTLPAMAQSEAADTNKNKTAIKKSTENTQSGPSTPSNSAEPEKQTKSEKPTNKANPIIVLETTMGTIELELYPEKAPISVENFLTYIDSKFYDNTIFHRVIKGFMVQGGGLIADGSRKKTGKPIKNEADNGLTNDIGTISMARTARPDTATSQFFINVNNNTFLNHQVRDFGYAVFGKVVKGMDIVMTIESQETDYSDRPLENVVLIKARRK